MYTGAGEIAQQLITLAVLVGAWPHFPALVTSGGSLQFQGT